MADKMGFQGKIFYGVAGATATNEITNSRDINYPYSTTKGNTTVRGDGSLPPPDTQSVTRRVATIDWTMINKTTDANLPALLAAAYAGTPVAIRTKDYAAGKGFDGDVVLDVTHGKPLDGEQTYQFTATPNGDLRAPQFYV